MKDAGEEGRMKRRLTVEARRAEIIEITRRRIAEEGAAGLSLREVARWCDMSAPGLTHHFPTLRDLMDEVLAQRDAEDLRGIQALARADDDRLTLRRLADASVQYYVERPEETRHFDTLEAEAMSPAHPAHAYFAAIDSHTRGLGLTLAREEYEDPETVIAVLKVVVDGLRKRWVLLPENADLWGDWVRIRDTVFAGFTPLPDKASETP